MPNMPSLPNVPFFPIKRDADPSQVLISHTQKSQTASHFTHTIQTWMGEAPKSGTTTMLK